MREVPVGTAIRVRTPASSANLGPGFDSIGLALGVWDELSVTVVAEPGLRIEVSGSGADGVPRDESHLVYRSMARGLRELGVSAVSYTHLRAHETVLDLVCRLLLEKKNLENVSLWSLPLYTYHRVLDYALEGTST